MASEQSILTVEKVTSGVLLPPVEDTHALQHILKIMRRGPNREMTIFANDIKLFGVEMTESKEIFTGVIW